MLRSWSLRSRGGPGGGWRGIQALIRRRRRSRRRAHDCVLSIFLSWHAVLSCHIRKRSCSCMGEPQKPALVLMLTIRCLYKFTVERTTMLLGRMTVRQPAAVPPARNPCASRSCRHLPVRWTRFGDCVYRPQSIYWRPYEEPHRGSELRSYSVPHATGDPSLHSC